MPLQVSDTTLFYRENGSSTATPVVFLHGFPFNHAMWDDQATLLEKRFRVIRYDQRGHGQTPAGKNAYTLEFLVDDLFALLDHLKLPPCILVGLSMGGYVSLRAVERHPERFRALVLCDTRSEADSNEAKLGRAAAIRTVQKQGLDVFAEGFLKKLFATSSFERIPKAVEKVHQMMRAQSPEGVAATLVALATRTDTTAALEKIQLPTLILVGAEDPITPPAAAKAMNEKIRGSVLKILPNAAHMSNLENPSEFNAALESFLTSL